MNQVKLGKISKFNNWFFLSFNRKSQKISEGETGYQAVSPNLYYKTVTENDELQLEIF